MSAVIKEITLREVDEWREAVHGHTDLSPYLNALFQDMKIGPLDFWPLAIDCAARAKTGISPYKAIRRFERLSVLLRFLFLALGECSGPVAECGVLRGFSSLAMAKLMKVMPKTRDLWLVDSYEGLSEPVAQDSTVWTEGDTIKTGTRMRKGHFATPIESVRNKFAEFDFVKFSKGWIPDSLNSLPDSKWSFVHLDVDLYEPTRDGLNYFFPRLEPGGIIVNDDFGSAAFPGAGKAWREFFERERKGYAILDTGQAVFINR